MTEQLPPFRVLIVDDEVHGRDVVRHMLRDYADFVIAGEAANGAEAVDLMISLRPDIVFLDVQMPKLNGMDVLERVGDAAPGVVIFVTAHDRYAIDAFRHCALDYLLKPFDQERFERTLARARVRLVAERDATLGRRVRSALVAQDVPRESQPTLPGAAQGRLTRFVVKDAGRVFFVPVAAADWLEAAGNYVAVHASGKAHLVYESLANLEQQLDPGAFLRIHRSTVVNIERIKELQPFTNGEFIVVLHDGTKLKLSRSYRERADQVLGLG